MTSEKSQIEVLRAGGIRRCRLAILAGSLGTLSSLCLALIFVLQYISCSASGLRCIDQANDLNIILIEGEKATSNLLCLRSFIIILAVIDKAFVSNTAHN